MKKSKYANLINNNSYNSKAVSGMVFSFLVSAFVIFDKIRAAVSYSSSAEMGDIFSQVIC